jgi:hypothetical protein
MQSVRRPGGSTFVRCRNPLTDSHADAPKERDPADGDDRAEELQRGTDPDEIGERVATGPVDEVRPPTGVTNAVEAANVTARTDANAFAPIDWAAMSLARLFVDVPMSVSVPPSIEANDSGISSFEGAVFPSCARSAITGIRIATTGVLLTNLVRLIPVLGMSIASTVIVAGFANPEIPSRGESRPRFEHHDQDGRDVDRNPLGRKEHEREHDEHLGRDGRLGQPPDRRSDRRTHHTTNRRPRGKTLGSPPYRPSVREHAERRTSRSSSLRRREPRRRTRS